MRVKTAVLVLGMVVAACGAGEESAADPVETAAPATSTSVAPTTTTTEPAFLPPDLGAAGTLTNLDGWLQSDVESLEELRGQVVVVQFWTFGCYNCKNTLPHLQALYQEYGDEGLEIVGVHAPEFEREKDPDAISAAAVDLGVTWPIALDTQKTNFFGWQGSPAYWPRTFVIDQEGQLRFDRIGEGAYDELELTVATLLAEA